jgi:hypothetical protein
MSGGETAHKGSCACGAVRFATKGTLRAVMACHCGQCRKSLTNYGAFTAADRAGLAIEGEDNVTWYDSSPGVRRGFCRRCGSNLFWDYAAKPQISIAAGAFEQPSGLHQECHVFVADKADFYEIADGQAQLPQGKSGN